MDEKSVIEYQITLIFGNYVGVDDSVLGCLGCVFGPTNSIECEAWNRKLTQHDCYQVWRPASEFPPERLAKFRLTGEDDG